MTDTNEPQTVNATGTRAATIELWRMPDGCVEGRLRGMDATLIRTTEPHHPDAKKVAQRLAQIAEWTLQAASHIAGEATRLMPNDQAVEESQEAEGDAEETEPGNE